MKIKFQTRAAAISLAVILGHFAQAMQPMEAAAECPMFALGCHPEPSPIRKFNVPPAPSGIPDVELPISMFRHILENIGNEAIRRYNMSGREGSLSWSGPTPVYCRHDCVSAPTGPDQYRPFDRTSGFINLRWTGPFWATKDFSISTRLEATCLGWEAAFGAGLGAGRLQLQFALDPVVLVNDGNWVTDVADFIIEFFTGHYGWSSDYLAGFANEEFSEWLNATIPGTTITLNGGIATGDLGTCRSLGVYVDNTSARDSFIWDQMRLNTRQ
jgi:hypothetical protein